MEAYVAREHRRMIRLPLDQASDSLNAYRFLVHDQTFDALTRLLNHSIDIESHSFDDIQIRHGAWTSVDSML